MKAKNLGAVSAREFGRREACLMWVERFPARVNLNAFRSVIGAVYDVEWNRIPPDEDAEARRMAARLRRERGG